MQINQGVLEEQAGELGAGGWPFTPRQLYYACCAAVEAPQLTVSTSQMGCGAAMFLAGVFFSALASYYFIPAILVGMVVIGLGLQRRRFERNRPTTRALAMSWADFEREFIEPLRHHGSHVPEGLLLHAGVAGTGTTSVPALPSGAALVVACDQVETVALVQAALQRAGVDAAVCEVGRVPAGFAGTVYVLHGCDRDGCSMALALAKTHRDVVDVGLRPAQIVGRVQVIESAPVVVPPELGRLLTVDEVAFLASGRRVELGAVRTEQLAKAVQHAIRERQAASDTAGGSVRNSGAAFFEAPLQAGAAAMGGIPAAGPAATP